MTTQGRELLVAAPERWDEACFAVPALRALMASGMSVGVICRDEQQDLWQSLADLEVLAFPAMTKAKEVAATLRGAWQAALVWVPGMAAEAAHLAGVPRRLGPAVRPLHKLLTQQLGCAGQPMEHRVRFYLSAVEEMGIATDQPGFFAPATPASATRPETVLLCPDSDFGPNHEWLLDRWLEIASLLVEDNRRVAVAQLSGGRGMGAALANQLGAGAARVHVPPLGGVLAMLAGYGLVIAADGSLPHLAAHAGATCVTLFGPNDPVWKRPLGRRHAVVRRHVECAPCLLGKCPLDGRCQRELATARVWAAVREKLA